MLSQRGRYALKAMLHLSRQPGTAPRQLCTISAAETIPAKFLEAVIADLRRAGLVQSVRGRTGGYVLARPANLITFGQIMRVTDGPLALVPCVSHLFYERCKDCKDEASCDLRRVMYAARNAASAVFDKVTLADAVSASAMDLLDLYAPGESTPSPASAPTSS